MMFLWIIVMGLCFRYGYSGFCTQSYICTEKCIRTEQFHSKCGLFSLSTCTRYRLVLYSCSKTCYRQACCPGYTGKNCDIPTYHTFPKPETRTGKSSVYTTKSFVDTGPESTTVDQGKTSISNVSTTKTSQEVRINSTVTVESTHATLSVDTGLESTTTFHGLMPNVPTTNRTYTTKVYEFNRSDYRLELEIIALVGGCVGLILLVYMSFVCCYTIRNTKHIDKIFIVRLLLSCLCLCCGKSYYYLKRTEKLSRPRFERKRTEKLSRPSLERKRTEKLSRPSQLTTSHTIIWQEEQRNISKSAKADPINIKRIDNREESRACKREIDLHREENGNEIIKERILPDDDFQVCVVQPLKGSDWKTNNKSTSLAPFPNKQVEEHDERSLDWHSIFMFLMKLIQPAEWKLFGTQLLGNQHDVDVIATEAGNNIKLCIWNLFKKWHVIKGRDAKHADIEDAMAKLEWNLQLDDFRSFMKNPPFMQNQNAHKQIAELTEYTGNTHFYRPLSSKNRSRKNLAVYAARNFEQQSLENIQIRREESTENILSHTLCTGSTGYQQLTESAYMTEESPVVISNSSPVITGNIQWRRKRKRKLECTDDDAFPTVQKRRKKSKRSSLRHKHFPARRKLNKRNEKSSICTKLANWNDISKSCIINLIKIVLPLENQFLSEKVYNLFMDYTVSRITEQTGKTEDTILSIKVEDYAAVQVVSSKSRENYIIDTHKTSLLLDRESWGHLELYKLHAREKVLHYNRQYIGAKHDSVYLFISYQGQPLVEQVNNDSDHGGKEKSENIDLVKASCHDNNEAYSAYSMVEEPTGGNASVELVSLNGNSDNKRKERGDVENMKETYFRPYDLRSSVHSTVKDESKCKSTGKWEVHSTVKEESKGKSTSKWEVFL